MRWGHEKRGSATRPPAPRPPGPPAGLAFVVTGGNSTGCLASPLMGA